MFYTRTSQSITHLTKYIHRQPHYPIAPRETEVPKQYIHVSAQPSRGLNSALCSWQPCDCEVYIVEVVIFVFQIRAKILRASAIANNNNVGALATCSILFYTVFSYDCKDY